MALGLGLGIWFVEVVAIAAFTDSRRRARQGLVVAMLLLALPAFVIGPRLVAMCALMTGLLFCAVRTADFAFDGPLDGFRARLFHLVAIVDTRLVVHCPRYFDWRSLVRLLAGLAVTIVAIRLVGAAVTLDGWRHYVLRWFAGGLVFVPAVFAAVDGACRLIGSLLGRVLPVMSHAPLLSRSLNEFWAKRWNRVVSKILHDRFYKPFANHGTSAALFAAFAASAALHAWLIGMLMGVACAASWAAFFLAQPLLIAAERRLRVRHWRAPFGWLWTIAWLALLSPLFTEPLLRWLETF